MKELSYEHHIPHLFLLVTIVTFVFSPHWGSSLFVVAAFSYCAVNRWLISSERKQDKALDDRIKSIEGKVEMLQISKGLGKL